MNVQFQDFHGSSTNICRDDMPSCTRLNINEIIVDRVQEKLKEKLRKIPARANDSIK